MISIATKIKVKKIGGISHTYAMTPTRLEKLTLSLSYKLFEQRPSYPILDKHLQQQSKVARQKVSDLPLSDSIESQTNAFSGNHMLVLKNIICRDATRFYLSSYLNQTKLGSH